MAATIRLQRLGRKQQAHFRIVVSDVAESRDGPAIETLGIYNPRTQPSMVRLDAAAALNWLYKGAQPTDTVVSIFRKTGVWQQFQAGATADSLEEKIVTLGPANGNLKTSRRAETASLAWDQRAAVAAQQAAAEKVAAKAAAEKAAKEEAEAAEAAVAPEAEAVEEAIEASDDAEQAVEAEAAEESAEESVEAAADVANEAEEVAEEVAEASEDVTAEAAEEAAEEVADEAAEEIEAAAEEVAEASEDVTAEAAEAVEEAEEADEEKSADK